MKNSMIAIPEMPSNSLQYFTLHQEKRRESKNRWSFGDPDRRLGKRDARISPSIWNESLNGIAQEEYLEKEKIQNVLDQNIRDAREKIKLFPSLKDQNQKQIEALDAEGGLLPEAVASNMKKSANTTRFIAILLFIVEICGLFAVARMTFGNGAIGPLSISILLVVIVGAVTSLALSRASDQVKNRIFWTFIIIGGLLSLTGMVGFAILRASTFEAGLNGGVINFGRISLGNLLLMVGLTLGVPLIIGAMFEDAAEKRTKASNSLDLYNIRTYLDKCEAAWNSVLGKFEEYSGRIEGITKRIITSRQSNYRQGFHRCASGNPDATPHLKELMAATSAS